MRKNKNGFYQFACKEDGIYITVYSGIDGKDNANLKDALFYIEKRNIPMQMSKDIQLRYRLVNVMLLMNLDFII